MSIIEELRRRQRRELLGAVDITDRLIRQVYLRAAESLGKAARSAKNGTLTKRWLEQYEKSVQTTIEGMNREIYGAIESGINKAAKAATGFTSGYIGELFSGLGVSVPGTFIDALSHVDTATVDALIRGKLYAHGGNLSKRIWDATGRLQGGIEEILAQGLAQEQSTYQIARALEKYVNPEALQPSEWRALYPDTPFPMNVDYNATRVARTAVNQANWYAAKAAARLNPLCRGLHWELSGSHYARQVARYGRDICDEYAEHEEGLGRGNYPIDAFPMPHPQCLCDRWEVLPEPEEAQTRLRDWVNGKGDPELDKGFGKWETDKEHTTCRLGQTKKESPKQPKSMPADEYAKFVRKMKSEGIAIYQEPDVDGLLDKLGAHAMTADDGSGIYVRTTGICVSGAKEEEIHIRQIREGGMIYQYKDPYREYLRREIEAQQILLQNAKEYGIIEEEIDSINEALNYYTGIWQRERYNE